MLDLVSAVTALIFALLAFYSAATAKTRFHYVARTYYRLMAFLYFIWVILMAFGIAYIALLCEVTGVHLGQDYIFWLVVASIFLVVTGTCLLAVTSGRAMAKGLFLLTQQMHPPQVNPGLVPPNAVQHFNHGPGQPAAAYQIPLQPNNQPYYQPPAP